MMKNIFSHKLFFLQGIIIVFLVVGVFYQRQIINSLRENDYSLNSGSSFKSKEKNVESDPFQLNLYPVFDLPLEYFDTESVSIGAGSYSTLYEIPAYQSYPSTEITIPERYYSVKIQELPVIKSDEEIYGFNPEEDFFGTSIEESIKKYGDLARRFVGEPGNGLFVSSVEWADVTGDGDKEQIVSLIQMGANILGESNIVIKNNQMIFSTELDSFSQIIPAQNGNGFFLQWSDNHKYRDGFMMTRFIYDGEKFVPVYEQQTRYVRWNEAEENSSTQTSLNADSISNKTEISKNDAIETVKQLPEVKRYLSYFYEEPRTAHPSKEPQIIVDRENSDSYSVHVHEIDISDKPYISTTFNWYTVDKHTGEVVCSFTIYDDQGKIVKVSEADECDISDN